MFPETFVHFLFFLFHATVFFDIFMVFFFPKNCFIHIIESNELVPSFGKNCKEIGPFDKDQLSENCIFIL